MITALDTNIIVGLWDQNEEFSSQALIALEASQTQGGLVVSAPVYAELMAAPGRNERFLNDFFQDTGIRVEWELDEPVWRAAGRAFEHYARRKNTQKAGGPRRILADFIIGAHALVKADRLLTFNQGFYKRAFPNLKIATLSSSS